MADKRPTSPHIQIYRWQWTMSLSILHRATGIALGVGTLLLALWLVSIAAGPSSYARAQSLIGSWPALILLAGWTLALFYHLLNGLRHLAWDIGWGFELTHAYASGMVVLAGSIVLTIIVWIVGLTATGAL